MSRLVHRSWNRGVLLGVVQAGLLLSLGGQLLLDRALRPRGWIRTEPVDPFLPIRGRYVNLSLLVPAPAGAGDSSGAPVVLRSEAGQVRADLAGPGIPRSHRLAAWAPQGPGARPDRLWHLAPGVAFFIPPDVDDPSRRPPGEQLWVEVTLPAEGPPRPIRLGVRKGEGPILPLDLR